MNIVEFYRIHKVDDDFDHDYYEKSHPETETFYQVFCDTHNIDDRHRLYFHYVQYGKSHGFEKKPHVFTTPSYSAVKDDTKFILFSTYYNSNVRQEEIDYCIHKNIINDSFDQIFLFVNKNVYIPNSIVSNNKVKLIQIDTRTPSYLDWITFSKNFINENDFVSLFSNADIFFDETVIELKSFLRDDNSFVCISRYELDTTSQTYELLNKPRWSQDTWALNKKSLLNITFDDELNICTGKPRCDNKIAYKFACQGYNLYNPCYHIKSYHKHETGYRDYDNKKDAILGGTCFVEPTSTPNVPSYKQYIIGTKNVDNTNEVVKVSDYLSNSIFRSFNIICSDKNPRHLYGGWGSVSDQLSRIWKKNPKFNLITFLWEAYQSFGERLSSCSWVGIEHLVNYCPDYYENVLGRMPTISNFYNKLWNKGIIQNNCQGLLFTSRYTLDSNINIPYLNNINTDVSYHPILPDYSCKEFSMDLFRSNEEKTLINLGWFNRNFAFFERLNVDNFYKQFVFGGMDDWKYKIFLADMQYHGISSIITHVSDKLTDYELDEILSKNLIFVNLYDSSANNAIINAIQRKCPILLNRLPACEEYLGCEYPLFYENLDDINNLLSLERIEQAHEYLKNLDTSKFSLHNTIRNINNFNPTKL